MLWALILANFPCHIFESLLSLANFLIMTVSSFWIELKNVLQGGNLDSFLLQEGLHSSVNTSKLLHLFG